MYQKARRALAREPFGLFGYFDALLQITESYCGIAFA